MAGELSNPTLFGQQGFGLRPFAERVELMRNPTAGIDPNLVGAADMPGQPGYAPAPQGMPMSVANSGGMIDKRYAQPQPASGPPDVDMTGQPAGAVGNALMQGNVASKADMTDESGGIGLMGTLGIINMGAGLGAQIYKMATRKKERPAPRSVPTGGGVSFK